MVRVRLAAALVLVGLSFVGPAAHGASDGIPIGWSGASGIPLSQGVNPWEPRLSVNTATPNLSFQFGSVTSFTTGNAWVPGLIVPNDAEHALGESTGNVVYGSTPLGEVIGAQLPLNLTQAELVGNAGTIDSACQTLAAQHEIQTHYWNDTDTRETDGVPLNTSVFDQHSLTQHLNEEGDGESLNSWCGGIPIPGWYTEPFYMVVWAPILVFAVGTLGFFTVRRFQRP
jgi:hypothetical protein